MLVAMTALVFAFTGPALADGVVSAAKKINGKNLKSRSITGSKIKNNTITGTQVRESSLGKVKSATKADSATNATNATNATGIANGTVTTAKFGTIPSARVENTTGLNTATSTDTLVSYNTETFDTAGLHSSDNPSRLTAPVAGTYQVTGQIEWDSVANGYRFLIIRRNGTTRSGVSLIPVSTANFVYQQVTSLVKMNAGDYVELVIRQTSGGNLDVIGGGDEESQNFMMHWAGPA
jgi:hypothetical protein